MTIGHFGVARQHSDILGIIAGFATAKTFRARPIIHPGYFPRASSGRLTGGLGLISIELERLFGYNIYTIQG